jgi:hypothetical protein
MLPPWEGADQHSLHHTEIIIFARLEHTIHCEAESKTPVIKMLFVM